MNQIFISHAHDDARLVDPTIDQLKRHFHVWIDKAGVKQGDDWYAVIQQNLRESAVVLVMISNQSKASPWVLYEIEEAQKHGIRCHPYLIESISGLPTAIQAAQYIDGSQPGAFERMMDQLPQSARIQGDTVIPANLIGTATTFAEAAAGLPESSCLTPTQLQGAKYGLSLMGLPLRLTRYCKIFLVGRADDTLQPQDKAQLCVLMSGRDYRNYKVVVDAANHVITRPDTPLRLLLVEGPPNSDPNTNANGYGLDPERPDEWRDAYLAMKTALSFYPRAAPQIFFNGPGVLLYPLGADRRDHAPFELFQLKFGGNEYYRVLWRDLLFK